MSFQTIAEATETQTQCLNYAATRLEQAGLQVTWYKSGGIPSLVASSRPKGGKQHKLILQAHLDVVPGARGLFKLKQQDGQLLGRGTFDMKFAAACFIAAAESLAERNHELDYAIMFTCDEEIGGANGVGYLLDKEGYRSDVCFLPDGGIDWKIEEAAKGAWHVEARTTGLAAHGSRPWEGESAIHKLLDFLQEARKICVNDDPHEPTLVISQLQCGEAKNQVPDAGQAVLDIRYKDQGAKHKLQTELYRLAEQYDVQLQTQSLIEPCHLDVNLPQVQAWQAAVQKVTGRTKLGFDISLGASDAHYFSDFGIPTIVTRPRGGGLHGPDEWLNEQDLYDFHAAVVEFIPLVALDSA